MQATREQLSEDPVQGSNLDVMAQSSEHSLRSTHDLGSQETNSEFHEAYGEAQPMFEHSVRSSHGLGTQETDSEFQESYGEAQPMFEHSVRSSHVLDTQGTDSEFQESYGEAQQKFEHAVQPNEELGTLEEHSEDQESFHDAEEEEEFSFSIDGAKTPPIAAEDAFHNGQIKPTFPLFNQDLLLQERYVDDHSTLTPNVKKVLVQMNNRSLGDDAISGPFCEWGPGPEPEPERERCKKSSSTGFSKLWRLKDLVIRSHSNGRDAYVFLNNRSTSTLSSNQNSSSFRRREHKKAASSSVGGGGEEGEEEVKKGGKKKTSPLSSHEVYLKNKAKENDGRKKSYMPYKPEVVGFFTNVNGGSISKNVHPY